MAAIVVLFSITSCEDPNATIGAELLLPNDILKASFTDTLSVRAFTVLLDSTITSNNDKILVGRYQDPIFGTLETRGYFQIANVDTIKTTAFTVLDSLVLTLGYRYFYGDTTKPQSFTIHRVTGKIGQNTGSLTKRLLESLDSKNSYFSTDQIGFESAPLGKKDFTPRPIKATYITSKGIDSSTYNILNIKLNQSLGQELLSLSGKKAGSGLVNFKEYFKGMVLVPGANDNGAILGFEPNNRPTTSLLKSSYLSLYTHEKGIADTTFFSLSFSGNTVFNNRFNQVIANRNGTALADLKNPFDAIPSNKTGDYTFVQSGTGIATKIDLPYLKQLSLQGDILINRVELILPASSVMANMPPPIALNLALANSADPKRPLRDINGNLFLIPSEPGLQAISEKQTAGYQKTTSNYTFNITSYVQSIISNRVKNDGFFVTAFNDFRINRLVIDKKKIKLNVYYTKSGK